MPHAICYSTAIGTQLDSVIIAVRKRFGGDHYVFKQQVSSNCSATESLSYS